MNQYQVNDTFGYIDGVPINGFQILDSLHIRTDGRRKRTVVLIMFGWAVLYRILFYLVLRFASKNQRS